VGYPFLKKGKYDQEIHYTLDAEERDKLLALIGTGLKTQ
jgi:hypothetical protein